MIALEYDNTITLGTIIQIVLFFGVGLAAFLAWREKSRTNTFMIGEMQKRLDRCDIEQIKERTNILWIFQLRRGLVEAELKGLGTENSPFKLTDTAQQLIAPIVPQLRAFYEKVGGDDLGLVELANLLEINFGRQITELVCKKAQISEPACMVIAIANLREISNDLIDEELAHLSAEISALRKLHRATPRVTDSGHVINSVT